MRRLVTRPKLVSNAALSGSSISLSSTRSSLPFMTWTPASLKLDPETDLPLSSGQDLYRLAERLGCNALPAPDGGRVLAVQDVEEFEQHVRLDAVRDAESLGETHIEIGEGRSSERVASRIHVDPVHRGVAV